MLHEEKHDCTNSKTQRIFHDYDITKPTKKMELKLKMGYHIMPSEITEYMTPTVERSKNMHLSLQISLASFSLFVMAHVRREPRDEVSWDSYENRSKLACIVENLF